MKKCILAVLWAISMPIMAWQPTKPIESIIGFAPGSVNEIVMRSLAQEVEKNTGTKFLVINRPGAGGVVGSEYFSRKPNDGHHVMMVSLTGLTAMDMVAVPDPSKGRSYTLESFNYVLGAATTAYAIVTKDNDRVSSAADFIKEIRNTNVTLGSSGGSRMVYEILNLKIKPNNITHVPYGSPAQQIVDVAGGNLRFGVIPAPAVAGFLDGSNSAKIKVIAVTSAAPLKQWPMIKPLSSIIPDLIIASEWGLILPAGTSKTAQDWYVREFTRALKSESVRSMYDKNLLNPMDDAMDPVSFKNFVISETKKHRTVVETILKDQNKK